MPNLFAEVMDKMPGLEGTWLLAVAVGVLAFLVARTLSYGWLAGLFATFCISVTLGDWFDDPVAAFAMAEDPVATWLARTSPLAPFIGTLLGTGVRRWKRREPIEPLAIGDPQKP